LRILSGYLGGGDLFIRELPYHNCIKLGNIWIPPGAFETYIGNCVRPVIIELSDDENKQGFNSLGGSSTLIKCDNQPFICLTGHQISNNTPLSSNDTPLSKAMESVLIGSYKSDKFENLSFDQVVYTTNCLDEEFNDILFARPNSGDELYHSEMPYFFPVKKLDGSHIGGKYMFIGYPISLFHNHLNSEGKSQKLELVTLLKDCELDENFKPEAAFVNRFKYQDDGGCLNGISGGAVFGLKKMTGGYEGFLCGIITRAGNGHIYTISANHLLSVTE